MTLQNLYFITEIVGGIAIIGSLIFVALQVRQNTEAMRVEALERHADHFRILNLPISENADMADIFRRGLEDLDRLDPTERVRFMALLTMAVRGWEKMFLVRKRRALDEGLWSGSHESFKSALTNPGLRAYWHIRRSTFCQDFRDYVDATIAEGGGQPLYGETSADKAESRRSQ
jgi:hypothetical protein